MPRHIVAASRYLVVLAVVCVAIASAATFLYGAILTIQVITRPLAEGVGGSSTKTLMLGTIELVDLFLLGTTLYVIAIGLYELFVDDQLPSPAWLIIRDLDDLKPKILGIVIVILVVQFLGQLVAWDGSRDLLTVGAAVAIVIAASTYFLGKHGKPDDDHPASPG